MVMRKCRVATPNESMDGEYGWNSSMICVGQLFGKISIGSWERKESYYIMKKMKDDYENEVCFGKNHKRFTPPKKKRK
tara:strand:- start:58 stop:291 length:234 start_codon:yes stop_codon:yes gene_type:complete